MVDENKQYSKQQQRVSMTYQPMHNHNDLPAAFLASQDGSSRDVPNSRHLVASLAARSSLALSHSRTLTLSVQSLTCLLGALQLSQPDALIQGVGPPRLVSPNKCGESKFPSSYPLTRGSIESCSGGAIVATRPRRSRSRAGRAGGLDM
jgi:hypothetical protein